MLTPFVYSNAAHAALLCRVIFVILEPNEQVVIRWLANNTDDDARHLRANELIRRVSMGILPFNLLHFIDKRKYEQLSQGQRTFIDMIETLFHANLENVLNYLYNSTTNGHLRSDIFALVQIPYFNLKPEEFDKHKTLITQIIKAMIDLDYSTTHMVKSAPEVKLNVANNIHPFSASSRINKGYHKLLLQAFAREFLTGEFVWRMHVGLKRETTFFGKIVTTQIIPEPDLPE